MYVLRTMNSLSTSFWIVPVSWLGVTPCSSAASDVEREDRQHGAVHRHRHAHLVERDVVEQLAHVEDRVDGHAGHADVAGDARVVAVVAAVGRQVEGDRQALLAGGQVAAVERVGLLGGGEAGVLADRPRLVDVHRRVRAAQVRDDAGVRVEEVDAVAVGGGVQRADVDALRRLPRRSPAVAGGRGGVGERSPSAAGWSRSRGCSWHLQEVEELGRAWRGRRHRRARPARCRPAACRRCTRPPRRRRPAPRRRRRRGRRRRRRWSTGRRRWRPTCGSASAMTAASSVGGPAIVATPPTSNTLRANDRRGVNVAGVPIVARKTVGRARPSAT